MILKRHEVYYKTNYKISKVQNSFQQKANEKVVSINVARIYLNSYSESNKLQESIIYLGLLVFLELKTEIWKKVSNLIIFV